QTLTAKLVLAGDSKSLVGAAAEGSTALTGLKGAADAAGDAGAKMAIQLEAAKLALEGEAHAAEAAALAIAEGGDAKRQHIAYLTDLVNKGAPAAAAIDALSKAQADYGADVAKARALLDAGALSQAGYAKQVEFAAQKLALARVV